MAALFLNSAIATTVGQPISVSFNRNGMVVQAILRGTSGACSATAHLFGSNDPKASGADNAGFDLTNAGKETLATFTLSGNGGAPAAATSVVAITAQYKRFWCDITAISGTGAAVTIVGST